MSRGDATRPSGMDDATRAITSPARAPATISVSTHPGATAFTVTCRGASSMASDLTSEIIAPFEAA